MLETASVGDFAARVADFYRRRGYTVHENVKVRGASEKVYMLRLVAEGELGALAISFGDAGGADEHEAVLVRGLAKDIRATPVLATPHPDPALRRAAARLAVVILDEEALTEAPPQTAAQTIRNDLAAHPWPTSGRKEDAPAAAWPSGSSRAVEVDDWLSDLTRPKTPDAAMPEAAPVHVPSPGAAPAPSPTPVLEAEADLLMASPSLPTPAAFDWLNAPSPAPVGPRSEPTLVALEHASTVVAAEPATQDGPGVLEVVLPPALVARASAAEAAYVRLRWVKRLAWGGLGLLGLFLFFRYGLGL